MIRTTSDRSRRSGSRTWTIPTIAPRSSYVDLEVTLRTVRAHRRARARELRRLIALCTRIPQEQVRAVGLREVAQTALDRAEPVGEGQLLDDAHAARARVLG